MGADNTTTYARWIIEPKTITLSGWVSEYPINCSDYTTITVYIDTGISNHNGEYKAMINVSPTTTTNDQIAYYWNASAYNGSCTADIKEYDVIYVWSSVLDNSNFIGASNVTTITLQ